MKFKNYIEKSSVFQMIHRGREVEKEINDGLDGFGISYFQSLLLVAIHVEADKTFTVKEFAELFPLSKGAISQHISTLESKSLIKRVFSGDRRSSNIGITASGKKLADKIMGLLENFENQFE